MAISELGKKLFVKYRPYLPIILILTISAFLRLYKISDYMTFLGDEGRDATVWLRMVREYKFTLIGPMTSIGNMYLGPLYYYLMLPFYCLFGLNPIGPSIGVAFFSIATTFLLWFVGRKWFNDKAGLIASFFYAISPVVILHSRSSWNPNVMPFFALLTLFSVWEFWQRSKYHWLIITGVSLSFAVQSHYLGLLLIPVVISFWLWVFFSTVKNRKSITPLLFNSFLGLIVFLLLTVVPLVWFDLRHDFLNFHSFQKFFGDRQTTVNFKIYKAIPNLWPLWENLFNRLVAGQSDLLAKIAAIGFIVFILIKRKLLKANKELSLCFVWVIWGLIGLGLYKQHIYDHYFGFLFPAIFLLLGFTLSYLWDVGKKSKALTFLILLLLTIANLQFNPLKYQPNYQLKRVQEIDRQIIKEAGEKPFNFALIAKQNYEAGYTYFFDYWKAKIVYIEPQKAKETIVDQLFVVCEDIPCQPINHPKAEIANFGWSRIEKEWTVAGFQIYKLVHNLPQ